MSSASSSFCLEDKFHYTLWLLLLFFVMCVSWLSFRSHICTNFSSQSFLSLTSYAIHGNYMTVIIFISFTAIDDIAVVLYILSSTLQCAFILEVPGKKVTCRLEIISLRFDLKEFLLNYVNNDKSTRRFVWILPQYTLKFKAERNLLSVRLTTHMTRNQKLALE